MKTIAVFGDSMLDRQTTVNVRGQAKEKPTLSYYSISSEEEKPGGTANVAANLRALYPAVELVTIVGHDGEGRALESILQHWGVQCSVLCKDHPTLVRHRYWDGNELVFRLDVEHSYLDMPTTWSSDDSPIYRALRVASLKDWPVVLVNYNKGFFTPKSTRRILEELCDGRRLSLIHVEPGAPDAWKWFDSRKSHFKVNLREAVEFLAQKSPYHLPQYVTLEGIGGKKYDQLHAHFQGIIRYLDKIMTELEFVTPYVWITLGEYGAIGLDRTNGYMQFELPPRPMKVVDVCGAGDSALAAFVATTSVTPGRPTNVVYGAALQAAVRAGSAACQHRGTYVVQPADLRRDAPENVPELAE